MTIVLALDQGTSATKALVVDTAGPAPVVLAESTASIEVRTPAPGAVEVEPERLWDSVLTAGRAAVADAGLVPDVVGLANQGETVLAWDTDTGRALSPAVVWQDRRAQRIVDELRPSHELLADATGLIADPYFSAPKMAWLRRNVTADGVVTTTDAWLVHRLCGAFVTDVVTAGRSMLTRLDRAGWDEELLRVFGLEAERLPRIVDNDEAVGATACFGGDVPLAGLIVDQQAALLAQGCVEPGAAKCTFGTGAFLLAHAGARTVASGHGLAVSPAWRMRDRTAMCLDGQVYTAASVVTWLHRVGLISGAADIDAIAATDAGGVVAVPALAGLAAPRWRPRGTATFAGMTLATGRGELVLAAMQGIAAQVAELVDAAGADLGETLPMVRADGGLTRCRTLMQAVADIAQVPVAVAPAEHATALGVAITARLSVERTLAVHDTAVCGDPAETLEPRWSADRAAEFRARWADVAASVLETPS